MPELKKPLRMRKVRTTDLPQTEGHPAFQCFMTFFSSGQVVLFSGSLSPLLFMT